MHPESICRAVLLAALVATGHALAAAPAIDPLDSYRQQGVEKAEAERGRRLWFASDGGRGRTSCHGAHPAETGQHATTGKAIEPMAPSLNPARYRDAEKTEKWFLRNCKWTFGRECSAQEKADILAWLASQ